MASHLVVYRRTQIRCLVRAILVLLAAALLIGIAFAYQEPALRKSIVFSGFGLC